MQAIPCVCLCVFVLPELASNNVSLLRKTTCQTHPCVKQGVEARERKRDKKRERSDVYIDVFLFLFQPQALDYKCRDYETFTHM